MKIQVLETTLRDGVQAEGINLSYDDKRALINLFDNLGFDFIEAGTPYANPKDKQLLCGDDFPSTKVAKLVAFGATRRKNNLTEEDTSLKALAESNAEYVSLVGKSSVTHIEKVLNVTREDNLMMIYDSVRYLSDKGKTVFFDAEHFFDAYKADAVYALETLRTAKNAGASLLVLCDTNGASLPEEVYGITNTVVKKFKKVNIGIHCHNDSGLAVANTMEAVRAGATHVQGTFLGFGERCGNCNLSTAVLNLQLKENYELVPDENLKKFTETARHVAEITNIRLLKNLPYVGKSAFSHKGGMHADGVLKYPPAFEHIDPSEVGNERRFLLSEVGGRAVFNKKAAEIMPDRVFSQEDISALLDNLKLMEMQGYQFEGADASFKIFIEKSLNCFKPHFDLAGFSVETNQPTTGNSSTAKIAIRVGNDTREATACGNGPVDALDTALREVLCAFYPEIERISLTDYKVRVINSEEATKATVRVLITTAADGDLWTTVGVSTDVIDASWKALCDSFEYYLCSKRS